MCLKDSCWVHFLFFLFADDIQLYYLTLNSIEIRSTKNFIKNEVHKWTHWTYLYLNATKCKNILFGTSNKLENLHHTVLINDLEVSLETTLKNVGVTLDSQLSFNKKFSQMTLLWLSGADILQLNASRTLK